jgi:replicative DNA helicase
MNLTLSIDERLVKEARRAARAMGKSLNQVVRDYLEQLTARNDPQRDIEEIRRLSDEGQGRSRGWRFHRSELHGRP